MPRASPVSGSRAFDQNDQGFFASVRRFLQRSYAADYVCVFLLALGYFLIQLFVDPFHRMFYLDDINHQYPHALHERVPLLQLLIYSAGIPALVLLLWVIFARPDPHKAHVVLLGLLISHVLTMFITDTIKNAVGRPRPDLIARCKPPPDTPKHQLLDWTVCTETNHHTLHDGWRSFPSGHSSTAFAGLFYLSLFFAGQLHALQPRSGLAVMLVSFLPLLGAAMIAISRCEDYRHDVYDVTFGGFLGMAVAWFTYRRFFPGLRAPNCDIAYPKDREGMEKRRVNDEESRIGNRINGGFGDEDEEDRDESRPLTDARS